MVVTENAGQVIYVSSTEIRIKRREDPDGPNMVIHGRTGGAFCGKERVILLKDAISTGFKLLNAPTRAPA